MAEEVFASVLLKLTKDDEVETFKERAETVCNTTVETAALCLRSIGFAEAQLCGRQPPHWPGGGGGGGPGAGLPSGGP